MIPKKPELYAKNYCFIIIFHNKNNSNFFLFILKMLSKGEQYSELKEDNEIERISVNKLDENKS